MPNYETPVQTMQFHINPIILISQHYHEAGSKEPISETISSTMTERRSKADNRKTFKIRLLDLANKTTGYTKLNVR